MELSEVYRIFLYLCSLRERQIDIANDSQYSQVTIHMIPYSAYVAETTFPERKP